MFNSIACWIIFHAFLSFADFLSLSSVGMITFISMANTTSENVDVVFTNAYKCYHANT